MGWWAWASFDGLAAGPWGMVGRLILAGQTVRHLCRFLPLSRCSAAAPAEVAPGLSSMLCSGPGQALMLLYCKIPTATDSDRSGAPVSVESV